MVINKHTGFTLVELIMIIVLLGVLSATALPKFFDNNSFAERAFFDDTLNAVRYAQILAVATGCIVQVSIASNSYTITRQGTSSSTLCPGGSTYALTVSHPSSGSTYTGNEPGIDLTSTVSPFYFKPLGASSSNITLTMNNNRTLDVIAETGFVYDSTP